MASPLLDALQTRHGLPLIDQGAIEAFLAPAAHEPAHALLIFAGAAAPRPEMTDVAVVLPELLQHFSGRLRGAVIAAEAEESLRSRLQVIVAPSLVLTRGSEVLGVLARIQDWSDYVTQIESWLHPDTPAKVPSQGPRTEITRSARSIDA